jgi:hypothetical protein
VYAVAVVLVRNAVLVVGLGAAIVFAAPSVSQAQSSDETFQEAAGPMWGIATFKLGLVATSIAMAAYLADCNELACLGAFLVGAVGLGASLVIALATGLATGLADAPADVPFAFHHAFFGFGTLFAITAGITLLAEDERSPLPAFIAGGVGAIAAAAYTIARRDEYVRDPELTLPAHLMTWIPFGIAAIFGATVAAGGADNVGAYLLAIGLTVLVCYGANMAWAESELASEPAVIAPLTFEL